MSVVHIEPGQLGARIRQDEKGAPKAVQRAIFSAMHRGRAYIIGKTPVDRGILRNAWKVMKLSGGGAELVNDQPYAGIIERGARPFKMSKAGIEALKGWVKRKILDGALKRVKTPTLFMDWKSARAYQKANKKTGGGIKKLRLWQLDDEATSIAYAIAKHFERVGMKGKRFVWQALPELAKLMEQEIERSLSTFFNRPI